MTTELPELLFVYNADAGLVNGLLDTLHKTFSPATYACSLCAVTYGATAMRPQWREFINELPARAIFRHRNELLEEFPQLANQPLPAVFRRARGLEWEPFLTATELKAARELPQLMQLVTDRL
ncbi:hypothetical protein SAMN06265337_0607 [Hymenobacter gelipurpurascens]|uniref:GTPase n=1 Tax=Hymenobacter gelipurpurascens TaxID=89968 RepID=A0A212T7S9_9BACT|nr:hypothetical protein [Hymenobacter gelipurpurascens]SNC62117.1 hypothetical protein SAMN06265337_0607 [Hymenobacter gelipurpurascens]